MIAALPAIPSMQPEHGYRRPMLPPIIAAPMGPVTSPLSSPVPDGTPTNAIYEAPDGSQWEYNPATSEWQQLSAANVMPAAQLQLTASESSVQGTPVPYGYPTSEIYTNPADGSEWAFNGATWQEISAGTAAASATLTASVSATTPSWFTENTIVASVPNWVFAAGGGLLLLMTMMRRK